METKGAENADLGNLGRLACVRARMASMPRLVTIVTPALARGLCVIAAPGPGSASNAGKTCHVTTFVVKVTKVHRSA
jgi:hypothetical protein